MKHQFFRALILIILFSSCSVSAEPVATDSSGFLSAEASATIFVDTTISESPVAVTATITDAAETPIPFYMEGPVASSPYLPVSDPLNSTLRIVSSLFAVIILAFGLSWLIQKKTGFGSNVFGKVLGVLPLDNRRIIYLVDILGKVLILGVTDSNINMLGEVTDKDTLDALRLQNEKPLPGMERLFSFLRHSTSSEKSTDQSAEGSETKATQGQAQNQRNHERLRKLNDLLVKRDIPPEN